MSGDSDTWQTPEWIVERVLRMGPIAVDPCASRPGVQPTVPAIVRYYDPLEHDGLESDWAREVALYGAGAKAVYVNPPYSRGNLPRWASKCAEQPLDLDVFLLVPSRTGERWFAETVWDCAQAACFLVPRVSFVDPATGKPAKGGGRFSSVIVYYGARRDEFLDAFEGSGNLARLNAERNWRAAC